MDTKHLSTYLNDHLGGATLGTNLAERIRDNNEGTPLGDLFVELSGEIAEDRETLLRLMSRLEIGQDAIKVFGGRIGELVARLKLNNRLFGYSPLSRLVELESMFLGIRGKQELWLNLDRSLGASVPGFDFKALAERAERQRHSFDEFRRAAAEEAFGSRGESAAEAAPSGGGTAG